MFQVSQTQEAYVLTLNYLHSEHLIHIYYVTYPLMIKVRSIINEPLENAKYLSETLQ